MPVALSQKAAAEYLGISVARLRKIVAAGYLSKLPVLETFAVADLDDLVHKLRSGYAAKGWLVGSTQADSGREALGRGQNSRRGRATSRGRDIDREVDTTSPGDYRTPDLNSNYGTFKTGIVPKNLLDTRKHGTNESGQKNGFDTLLRRGRHYALLR